MTLESQPTLPWYKPEIGARLKPETVEFFEAYSKIPRSELEEHLHKIVSWRHYLPL